VLEVGCAEADWIGPIASDRPDLTLVGLDWRPPKTRRAPSQSKILCGDILTFPFPSQSFDVAVGISSIEHIGLGHYGDPVDSRGDIRCMERLSSILTPGGWVYFDVPYDPAGYSVLRDLCRIYDDRTITRRLLGGRFCETWRGYFSKDGAARETPQRYDSGKSFGYVAIQAQLL
jgi:SAM-dependent methyltransferase